MANHCKDCKYHREYPVGGCTELTADYCMHPTVSFKWKDRIGREHLSVRSANTVRHDEDECPLYTPSLWTRIKGLFS